MITIFSVKTSGGEQYLSDKRARIAWRGLLLTMGMVIITILFLYPFASLIAYSLNRIDANMNPLLPWPAVFSLKFYQLAFTEYGFQRYILNTVWVVLVTTLLSTLAATLAGYALAKLEFAGRKLLFLLILSIMLLPGETMLIPEFVVMRDLGLINSYWALILPSMGGAAFGIFLMRQYMLLQLPTEILHAARIDGCSELGLIPRIVLPMMKGPILVLATLSIRSGWNALLWPQIVLTDEAKKLLMPAIVQLDQHQVGDAYAHPVAVAAAILSALVPLAFYLYVQRHFVPVLASSIKR